MTQDDWENIALDEQEMKEIDRMATRIYLLGVFAFIGVIFTLIGLWG